MEQIGRYDVERLLARGGMAEVFVGKVSGPGGFSKRVVIKRILPTLAQDPQFIEMFLSEARLAALLNHPNIVQIFDFGEHDDQYYLAMEYVVGQTLRAILRSCQKAGKALPLTTAVRIVASVCEGLHYAHCLCDDEGEPYNIVHRDVAPDNVIISSTGVPKVVDFGIAKAESNVHHSQVGTVKGKYAYMSPELIRSEGVDRQLDVYALGVMLYELTVGRRPYEGATGVAMMQAILDANAQPAHNANPSVPVELSHIISVAMHAQKSHRYATAYELQLALEEWLLNSGTRVGAAELAALVRQVSLEDGGPGSKSGISSIARTPGVRHEPGSVPTPATPALRAPRSSAPSLPAEEPSTMPSVEVDLGAETSSGLRRKAVLVAAMAIAGVALGAVLVRGSARDADAAAPPVRRPAPVAVPAVSPTPAIIDEVPPRDEPLATPAPEAAKVPPAPEQKRPRVLPSSAEDGFLTLRTAPWGDVFLGTEKLGSTPLVRAQVPSGKLSLLVVNAAAGMRRTVVVTVEPGEEKKQALVLPTGSLEIDAAAGTEVALDGVVLGVAPLGPLDVVEGRHELRLGAVVKVVKVREGSVERVEP